MPIVEHIERRGPSIVWAVVGHGLATIVFGLSHDPILSFVMLFLTGAFDNISVVIRGTLMQLLTPDEMRGRVEDLRQDRHAGILVEGTLPRSHQGGNVL